MKKIILAALLALSALPAGAQQAGRTGFGLIGGSPIGVTAKHWFSDLLALDGGIGYGNAAVFYADLLINDWRLLPETKNGRTNLYAGIGPRIATDDGGQFALRFMGGAGYWPSGTALELFAEIGPTLKLTPDHKVGLDGGLGVRYYFDVTMKPAR